METKKQKTALVTGSAGFIGFHTSKRLLDEGWRVIGVDCISDYYEVSLKKDRENILQQSRSYRSIHARIEHKEILLNLFKEEKPEIVIHLAAQAGVRHSIDNPRSYLESNIIGTFELLEAARAHRPKHILIASTSSVYGANDEMPYRESDKADNQLSFYAATKKSTENIAHSYSHLFNLPITMFRFFTVYGPWGRPDMAYYKFTKAIIAGKKIEIFNNGRMQRDFTYIDDLTEAIWRLINVPPSIFQPNDSEKNEVTSGVAAFRVINIGNKQPIELMSFVQAIENAIGKKAKINFLPMQAGDVKSTWADTALLKRTIGYIPKTTYTSGVVEFVSWYKQYSGLEK